LATPTEAAAMGALGALVLMLAYRRMTWQRLRQAVHNTLQTSSMVLFLAVASNIYSSVFTRLGTTTLLAETLLELPISPMTMLALLMLVIFILGWPLE
jgi:TRAP-type mannitol/chloroaromatic compound transport system permease large subunit